MLARMQSYSNVSWIPADPAAITSLAKRMGMRKPEGPNLLRRYHSRTERVRGIYSKVLERLRR